MKISLSDTFRRIYEHQDEINAKIDKMVEQWEKEDDEKYEESEEK